MHIWKTHAGMSVVLYNIYQKHPKERESQNSTTSQQISSTKTSKNKKLENKTKDINDICPWKENSIQT
jgi:uncharacterized FlaG/YvyC family protein